MNYNYKTTVALGIEKECPVCKKLFYINDIRSYAYKININDQYTPVCSWKCLQKYNALNQKKREAKYRKMIESQLNGSR